MALTSVDKLRVEITSSTAGVDSSIDSLIGKLGKLSSSLGGVSGGGYASKMGMILNITKSVMGAFSDLLGVLGRVGSKLVTVSKQMLGLNNAFGFVGKSSASVTAKFTALASRIGLIYASLFPLLRLFSGFKKLTNLAASLTEIQNVVDVTFGKMAYKVEEFTETSIKKFALAGISAKKYASQYQAMGTAMGITNGQVKSATNFLQRFSTVTGDTAGYDKASASMADMSLNLTKLTGDMSSFFNVEQDTVARALQSGIMAGNTRPLRQYGLDLTQATLAEWAMKNGLDSNIKTMSQAEKTMLRYQYVMANTAKIQGDFERTSGTWANQVRILKQQFQQLGVVIGSGLIQAFRPFLVVLNEVLSKVISFSEQVFNALGQIFGWKIKINAAGVTNDLDDIADYSQEAEDSTDGTANNLDDAADSAKKLNKQLQGFDKLNNLTTPTSSKSPSSGSNGGSGGNGGDDNAGAGGGANNVMATLIPTESAIKSKIKSLYELGDYIGKTLTDVMNDIPWNKVYKGAENFGKGLAEFLNGLISPELFSALGRTIANAINTKLHFLDSFGKTFNWTNFGKSLGEGLNSFLGNMDWKKYISVNATLGGGIAKTINAAVDKINWGNIGHSLAMYIQGMITKSFVMATTLETTDIGEGIADFVNRAIQEAPAFLAGATIKTWSTKIFDGLSTAIGLVKWSNIPKLISKFIDGLKPKEIGESLGTLFNFAIMALNDIVGDKSTWKKIGDAIGDAINGVFESIGTRGARQYGKAWSRFWSGVITLVAEAIDSVDWNNIGKLITSVLVGEFEGFDTSSIAKITDALVHLLGGIIEGAITNLWYDTKIDMSGFGKSFVKAFEAIDWSGLWLTTPIGVIGALIDATINFIKKTGLSKIGKAFVNSLNSSVEKEVVQGGISPIYIEGFMKLGGDAFNFLKELGSKSFKVNVELARKGWASISKFVGTLVKVHVTLAKRAWSTITNFVGDSVKVFTTLKKRGWSTLKGFTGDAVTAFVTLKKKINKTLQQQFGGDIWAYVKRQLKNGQKSLQEKYGGDILAYVKRKLKDEQESLQDKFGGVIEVGVKLVKSGWDSLSRFVGRYISLGVRSNAEGGVFANGKWNPVQNYASGGIPTAGQLFWARENNAGAELVGTIGGHTAVMNNDQIVASVSDGVSKSMSVTNQILLRQNQILSNILAKEFGISSKDIFNAVRSENQNYMNRTGINAFAL